MIKEELQLKPKDGVLDFIRKRLSYDDIEFRYVKREDFAKEHRRFEMSGYEEKTGECTLHNLAIVNEFADLGIYNYTNYLFLDFYKGTPTLYYQYFALGDNLEENFSGMGTTEILYEIFQKTIFSNRDTRRRT